MKQVGNWWLEYVSKMSLAPGHVEANESITKAFEKYRNFVKGMDAEDASDVKIKNILLKALRVQIKSCAEGLYAINDGTKYKGYYARTSIHIISKYSRIVAWDGYSNYADENDKTKPFLVFGHISNLNEDIKKFTVKNPHIVVEYRLDDELLYHRKIYCDEQDLAKHVAAQNHFSGVAS